MTVRLSHIAERAGVSVASVSRVLNDKPGVAESTRRAVLTAIDVLGYERPTRLRSREAGLIGLIVPELENPIFPRMAQAVEVALVRHGYTPVLCTQSLGGVHEDDYVTTLMDRGVSGIIFVSGIHAIADTDPDRYQAYVDGGLPIVLVNGCIPVIGATCISADDIESAELAVSHLAQLGHRRIGLATGQSRYQPVVRRTEGFKAAMRRHVDADLTDADLDELVERTVFTMEGGATAAHTLLDRGVTAIVCGSDVMAIGAITTARRRGLSVPRDVSIVGSDDSTLIQYTDPPLTTVRQPAGAIGRAAAAALVDQISGVPAITSEMLFRPELVVRGTTAGLPL
ncbi:LacI family DNA-binding transcriptional regulator [Nocardioides iriomotensis]|uniref:LacI family DNA-binding transcriptional regulator n=1 Tax=Nocardioides iriomotensis TaxID=715784 RepID=A0A4Q5IX68_9ACTN|nr:LacI family DNA-binding transcriptional regulator [Nocardioides iriomotensis]RYU10757.1 LacI family DNA-binding transcriptional regulator [Nocardioides iriomotensis]